MARQQIMVGTEKSPPIKLLKGANRYRVSSMVSKVLASYVSWSRNSFARFR